jgi:prophage maintenance system killer protein
MLAVGRVPEQLDDADIDRLSAVLRSAGARSRNSPQTVAAELAAGIAAAQAFPDGNKRTALLTAAAYLEMRGQQMPKDWLGFAQLLEPIAAGTRARDVVDRLDAWLRDRG